MKLMLRKLVPAAVILLALPILSASAGEKPFPNKVDSLYGSLPEGFAIGRAYTAYDGSIDGSIFKMNLRTGEGYVLVPADVPFAGCTKLGMRVDPRSNYLFVAGCETGLAYVFDADTGAMLMTYPLPLPPELPLAQVPIDPDDPNSELVDDTLQIVNDLVITKNAVFITDSHQPLIYKIPLGPRGRLPASDAATGIILNGDFVNIDPADECCGANGIVASPDGKTLVIGHSNFTQLFRVDPTTGYADEIIVDPPLSPFSFLDGLVLKDEVLYILTPGFNLSIGGIPDDMIQVVALGEYMLTGALLGIITDDNMDGVASGAIFGDSLYVNGARYFSDYPSEKWITKLSIYDVEPVE